MSSYRSHASLKHGVPNAKSGRHRRNSKVRNIREPKNAYQQYRIRRQRQTVMFVMGMVSFFLLFGVCFLGFSAFKYIPEQAVKLHLTPSDLSAKIQEASKPAPVTILPETPLEFFQDKIAINHVAEQSFPVMMANPISFSSPLNYNFDRGTPLSQKLMPLVPDYEDKALTDKLQALFGQYSTRFQPHVYVYDPNDNSYSQINGFDDVPAASVIKLPILLSFFQRVDQGMFTKDAPILYQEFLKASGAGELQYKDSGDIMPALGVATNMIQISDNTCTNMMISLLGGYDRVNEQLHQLGLNRTFIRNWLPDLEGSNKISMYEMTTMLYNMDRGYFLTPTSRYDALNILRGTHNRRLLVDSLPKDAIVAHKTGDIGTALGDVGVVFMPQPITYNSASELSTNADPITRYGDYIIAIQVDRPYNDYVARDMIQQASRLVYDHIQAKHAASQLAHAATQQ